jgi:hypothetical protein
MGKASSAKKVARAARVGAASGPSDRRQLGFPALVVAIVVLGLGLVGFARATRDAQTSPTLQDHWHNAFGIYDCQTGEFLPDFQSEADPDGIHSHQDGLIHIHPFTASVTGKEATMSVFLTNMGAVIDDDTLALPGDESLTEGVECDGEPAVLQILRYDDILNSSEVSEIRTENLADTRFLGDLQGLTIALAPEGADIPLPPSADQLAAVSGQSREEGVEPPNTTAVPGPQDFGTVSGDG